MTRSKFTCEYITTITDNIEQQLSATDHTTARVADEDKQWYQQTAGACPVATPSVQRNIYTVND